MAISKKKAVPAYLEPEQAAALKRLSEKTRVPQQAYLREAVDMLLDRYKKELGRRAKR